MKYSKRAPQDKQQLLDILLADYQAMGDFWVDKKINALRGLIKRADESKIRRLKDEIDKPKI